MTVAAWRIATEGKAFHADDLTGAGAKISGGRWNEPGVPMVYCSSSVALACLETLVHLNQEGLPLNRYVVRIDIPDELFERREQFDVTKAGWDAQPVGLLSVEFGSEWIRSNRSLILEVPSVVVPQERNYLLNPQHPDMKGIVAMVLERFSYDRRLTK